MLILLTLLAVSLLTCSSQPDSAGTQFIFGFIRNADRNISSQLLSVTVLNSNNYDCLFSVQYREDYDDTKNPLVTKHFNVPAMNMTEVPIPSWYGWMYDSGGIQDDKGPWQLISANSSCPLTLIANNHDNATFQEDSYLVLPTTWAKYGQVFAFTLPPASSDVNQNQHISIIPTERDVKGVLKVGSNSFAFTAKLVGPTAYFMTKTPNSQPMTYKIEADGPILKKLIACKSVEKTGGYEFVKMVRQNIRSKLILCSEFRKENTLFQILAGITCAGNYKSCDHAAFMPQPMSKSLCQSETPYSENHPTFVRSYVRDINGFYGELTRLFPFPQGFYVNIPQNCPPQMMTVSSRGQYQLSDSEQTPLLLFPEFSGPANMHVDTAPINVVRYDNRSDQGWQGAFITTVPSTNQYIRGNSSFFTKNDDDTVEVIYADYLQNGLSLDGSFILNFALDLLPVGTIENVSYLAVILSVPKRGFHVISSTSDGPYVYCVIGRNENSMYGYYGGMNMPVYTSPSTTTPRIPSTSVPSSKPSTNIPTGISSTSAPSSEPSTNFPTGISSTSAPSSEPSTNFPTGISSTSVPNSKPSTNIPTGISSTSAPSSEPSTNFPTGISSTSAPSSEPSTNFPTGISSTSAPSSEPSTNFPTGISSTSVPSSKPSTNFPTGISSTSVPSSKPSTNIPTPSSTRRNRLTTSTAITTSAQTLQSSSTKITTRSSAPPLKTSTILPATTSSSHSFSSFFLAISTTCLWLLL